MLNGIFLGQVEKNGDPEQLGRLKVRVPAVYGIQGSVVGAIPVDDLPWALPMGLPAGGSNASGGFSMLPEVGDQVAVQFLDGEPEKPVWQWLMQTSAQAKTLQLHQYGATAQGTAGSPARAILTRNGHSLEIRPEGVILTTGEGQQVLLQTSQSSTGGSASLQTPKGQSVKVDDLAEGIAIQALSTALVAGAKVMVNAPTSVLVKTERLTVMAGTSIISVQGNTLAVNTLTGASLLISDTGNIAISSAGGASVSIENNQVAIGEPTGTGIVFESGKISISGLQIVINTAAFSVGTAAGFPVVLMTPALETWLATHTHTSSDPGNPTGPPIPPLLPAECQSTRMQTT